MAKRKDEVSIYDPVARADRMFEVMVEGPDLVIDCLDRDKSLSRPADARRSGREFEDMRGHH
jgi:hypothetical protein